MEILFPTKENKDQKLWDLCGNSKFIEFFTLRKTLV